MISKDTPVIILCGGEGSRIADVSGDAIPKPLIKIGDQPIVWHIIKIYMSFGYTNFVLALGHLGWEIKNYFLNQQLMNSDFALTIEGAETAVEMLDHRQPERFRVVFAETGARTQTGQRIALCRRYIDTPYFMVTYGDGVADVDLDALTRFAVESDRIGTVTSVRPSSRFGDIETGPDGIVRGFAEKQDAGGGHINGGFFVFKRDFLDVTDRHGDVMLERAPMDDLVSRGELGAYEHHGFWEPMDTMREYKQLNALWNAGNAPWKRW